MYYTDQEAEKAILVGVALQSEGITYEQMTEYLDELSFLAETAGAETVKIFTQNLDKPVHATFIGKGKLEEIKAYTEENPVDMVIFDDELSPTQLRNIESVFPGIKVLDRTNLILDIFASRARTAHAKTQVELAQYQYLLPRLTGMWTHLERQKGGIGLRGPGETEIETDRRIVDIISDVNLAYSEHARRYLHECGLPKERTYVTGSPMAEVLHANLNAIEASDIHQRLGLTKGEYILLSAHREENIDTEKNFLSLFRAVNAMAEKYDMPILYSCHPRSKKRLEATGFILDSRVIQHEPLGFHDYNCLQMNAFAVVSDSGTLPEESSFFTSVGHPFPAVCIRTSTERPEALDKGCFILAGIDEKNLLQAVDTAVQMNRDGDLGIPVPDYVEENVSTKVVKIIQSYTGVVDKMVWRKS